MTILFKRWNIRCAQATTIQPTLYSQKHNTTLLKRRINTLGYTCHLDRHTSLSAHSPHFSPPKSQHHTNPPPHRPRALLPLLARSPRMLRDQHKRRRQQRRIEMPTHSRRLLRVLAPQERGTSQVFLLTFSILSIGRHYSLVMHPSYISLIR
jgi:hypothetical protein